jgi:hypothetical protein
MAKGRVAGRSFNTTDEIGRPVVFQAGDVVPAEIANRDNLNPKIWELHDNVETVSDHVEVTKSDEQIGAEAQEAADEEMEEFVAGKEQAANGPDLDGLTVKQLIQIADESGVDRTGISKKDELIEAIRGHGTL